MTPLNKPAVLGSTLLCLAFVVSGASALAFENIWFRQASLIFGKSVWATSVVLASFMGGLALGNAVAARLGPRVRRPLLAYAALEVVVGVAALTGVLLLPHLPSILAPLFSALAGTPLALNATRLGLAFLLLVGPTTAMGMTLPMAVKALAWERGRFGMALGLLYGCNTLGAVLGVVLAEGWLIGQFGVRGTGIVAAVGNLTAAAIAAFLAGRFQTAPEAAASPTHSRSFTPRLYRWLAAGAMSGFLLLALEVLWFRFLQQFAVGSSLIFAVMLAVVLAGIGLGGLIAGAWSRLRPDAWRHAAPVAWLMATALVAGYAGFGSVLRRVTTLYVVDLWHVFVFSVSLMGAVSLASGVLFTLLGTAAEDEAQEPARAAGLFTLANTAGALLGSLVGGFVFIPWLGLERSFFVCALGYLAIGLLVYQRQQGVGRLVQGLAGLVAVAFVALFPHGLGVSYLRLSVVKYVGTATRLAAAREGVTESIAYLEEREHDEPLSFRLVTNGFSMSATNYAARRYMKLYAYLPVALHPAPRRALLISYGVGSTARALADTRELESIDVVDISSDVLSLSRVVYPEAERDPLRDPRVHVHVEDGRQFLLMTGERYDLITSEPPPPKNAGVVNLYTQEYFSLARQRLAPGGFLSYWLPVHNLLASDTRAIVHGFCGAFPDCSLWEGHGLDWMLLGSAGAVGPVTEERFTRQWRDDKASPDLRALGFDRPEDLGATFMADAPMLQALVAQTPPLTDDWPHRIDPQHPTFLDPFHVPLMDWRVGRKAFAESAWVKDRWPAALRERTLAAFESRGARDAVFANGALPLERHDLPLLHWSLTRSPQPSLAVLLLGSTPDLQRVARIRASRGLVDDWVEEQLAIDAIANRDWPQALTRTEAALAAAPGSPTRRFLRGYALFLSGDAAAARAFTTAQRDGMNTDARDFLTRLSAGDAASGSAGAADAPRPPARREVPPAS